MRILFHFGALSVAAACGLTAAAAQDHTLLLRQPDLSADHLAFVYAGDIWVARPDGSDPRRLTSSPATEEAPRFSPDGQSIAFTANYHGHDDVYVVPTQGGQPQRLTWHPGDDRVQGWTADGKAITFTSHRERDLARAPHLYEVLPTGGAPQKVMEATVYEAAYAPDGERLAYLPFGPAYNGLDGGSSGWKHYRGGTQPYVVIYDLSADAAQTIDGARANTINPMWLDGDVFFLSDRDGKALNLYRYDMDGGGLSQLTQESGWDIRNAAAHGGTIVYEVGGRLKTLDVDSGKIAELRIAIHPDLPQLQPGWRDAKAMIDAIGISPTGKRVLLTARGDVYTVPVDDGSTRNLTRSDGVRQMSAIWSPKGDKIAWLSDAEHSHELVVADQTGLGEARTYSLTGDTRYFQLLAFTGDGKRIVLQDNRQDLHAIDLDSGEITTIAENPRRDTFQISVTADGRWLAFTQVHGNFNRTINLYDFESGETTELTDRMADATEPAFSHDGKHLFFAASTNVGPKQVGLDMSSQEEPERRGLYAIVLAADGRSPLLPKPGDEAVSDEDADADAEDKDKETEGEGDDAKAEEADPDKAVTIDLEGIGDRVVPLPVALRNYADLAAGEDGKLYFLDRVQPGTTDEPPGSTPAKENALLRFDFEKKEVADLATGITGFELSATGSHLVARQTGNGIATAKIGDKIELKPVKLNDVRAIVDPRKEWAQILGDVWRMEKEFFYAEDLHGLDWDGVYKRYAALLPHVGRREDLNDLIVEMIAEMQVGHNRAGGGDVHRPDRVQVGLLGADLEVENNRYRITRIYDGEAWNPFLEAPLAVPGVDVDEGDYILAVNGREVTAEDNLYRHLEGTVGDQVVLTVSASPDGDGREVTVTPIDNERALRLWAWIEQSRAYVEEKTDGRVGYVYLPNTGGAGYTFFNRMFFAQADKPAMIIDERANGGGQAANYITDVLGRSYLAGWKVRDGDVFNTPGGAVFGPKVMLIDQDAGSGGDFLPYSFRHEGLGPLIGTRTWGGLIGISANPRLIDGGFLTVPFFRFFNPDGEWTIENEGVAPDIEVVQDPVAVNRGEDPQLDAAIAEVLKRLEAHEPVAREEAPDTPDRLGQ
ncbi:MAG: PDZ domain-containing protein [Rhodothalassiaceae bacterium]